MADVDYDAVFANTISDEDAVPKFEKINEIEYDRTKTDDAAYEAALDSAAQDFIDNERPIPKRRGRPKGSRNKNTTATRDAKEVSERLQGIMTGGTGMLAVVREHFQMTEEEAKDIADPLSAYMVRQEENSEYIREFLDKYDVLAAGIAVLTYMVRVWRDDSEYRAASSSEYSETARSNNVSNVQQSEQEGQIYGSESQVHAERSRASAPYIAG